MDQTKKRQLSQTFDVLKTTTLYVGLLAMFAGGLLYLLLTDLGYGNEATWLFVAAILSMGSAICVFFTTNMKDFPIRQLVLRCIGAALAIGFVVFIALSTKSEFYQKVNFEKVAARNTATIITLVFGAIGIVGQIANVVLTATVKDE